jgi:arsenic resistance protein ArsH
MPDANLPDLSLPNVSEAELDVPILAKLRPRNESDHPLRILLLYGSLRERSYSRFLTLEAERILRRFGADTHLRPRDLPVVDSVPPDHPKAAELRALSLWSEGQVWCSPERHGAITGILKNQIDWLPLESCGVRPTQGRTLAVTQVSGGSQSFNAVNTLRLLGRCMRMFTIPNQSSVPKAYEQFDEAGRMKPAHRSDYLTDRYSEGKEPLTKERAADLAVLSGAAAD